jgi:hypothetical protein
MLKLQLKPPVALVGIGDGKVAVTFTLSTEMTTLVEAAKPLPVTDTVFPTPPELGTRTILELT